jgi:arabinogalactan oligomer/maltooligosaccharide transport system substrate-binding protein
MKKHLWLAINVLLIAAFALAACQPAATPTTEPTKAAEPTAASEATKPPATTAPEPTAAPTEAPQIELTIWHAYHTGGSEEQALTQLVAAYMTDHPNVTVNVQNIPFDQIFNKWQNDVASGGTAADMFTAPNDDLGNWVRAGTVAPIEDMLTGKLDGYSKAGVDGVTVEGHIYAVPGIIKAVALYYNKDMVTTPPATTDDLLALVKGGATIEINQNNYHNFGFFPAFGGQLMDDTGKCVADQGGFADAMQYLVDLKAAGAKFETDGGKADTAFRQGQAAMIINGPWVLGDYKKDLGDKLGVAPMPAGSKGPSMPLSGIDGWYLNPNGQNMDAAVDLALYLFGKDGLTVYADVAGDPPARTDVQAADPLVKAFADAAAGGFPRPQSTEFGNWWGPFGDMVTKVIEGKSSPADGVAEACAAMNKANGK